MHLEVGLAVYALTWIVVIAGIAFGRTAVEPSLGPHSPPRRAATGDALLDTLTLWDGQWYLEIAERGYSYSPDVRSSVAFFPAYPLLVAGASALTRLPPDWVALLISHGFLLATYLLLFAYVRRRFPVHLGPGDRPRGCAGVPPLGGMPPKGGTPAGASASLPIFVLLSLGLFPPTFFMRMAYPESMFVFLTVAAMYGMQRNWRWRSIAAIVGLATATRFVGLVLLLPLAMHVWCTAGSARRAAGDKLSAAKSVGRIGNPSYSSLHAAARFTVLLPLALSGLLFFVLFQQVAFGDPLAFVKTQDFWRHRVPEGLFDKAISLASFDPLWLTYIPGSPGYAGLVRDPAPELFSLQFANPVFFVGAALLVIIGAWKGWLSWSETALAAGLVLVPYVAKGYEMCMASQGRFVAAAFPVYIVLGKILSRLSWPWAAAVLAFFATYLAIYSAMLAAGYVLI